jgi:hypothetical protein
LVCRRADADTKVSIMDEKIRLARLAKIRPLPLSDFKKRSWKAGWFDLIPWDESGAILAMTDIDQKRSHLPSEAALRLTISLQDGHLDSLPSPSVHKFPAETQEFSRSRIFWPEKESAVQEDVRHSSHMCVAASDGARQCEGWHVAAPARREGEDSLQLEQARLQTRDVRREGEDSPLEQPSLSAHLCLSSNKALCSISSHKEDISASSCVSCSSASPQPPAVGALSPAPQQAHAEPVAAQNTGPTLDTRHGHGEPAAAALCQPASELRERSCFSPIFAYRVAAVSPPEPSPARLHTASLSPACRPSPGLVPPPGLVPLPCPVPACTGAGLVPLPCPVPACTGAGLVPLPAAISAAPGQDGGGGCSRSDAGSGAEDGGGDDDDGGDSGRDRWGPDGRRDAGLGRRWRHERLWQGAEETRRG